MGQEIKVVDSLSAGSPVNTISNEIMSKDSLKVIKPISESTEYIEPAQKSKKIPARATLYSLVLPGLGQTYNGNYWKVPIIYSLFAGMYFLYEENNYKYSEFKKAYKTSLINQDINAKNENLPPDEQIPTIPINPLYEKFDQATLLQRKDYYKRQRDFNIIMGVLIWGLNILDANVDAHLMDYDISPDLSLNVKPEINNFLIGQNISNRPSFGLKFVLSLH